MSTTLISLPVTFLITNAITNISATERDSDSYADVLRRLQGQCGHIRTIGRRVRP